MEAAQELAAKRADENSPQLRSTESPSWQERTAWLLLCGVLIGVGLYILANYLRALAWALVLAIAIWPSYDRVRRQASPLVAKEVLPVCSPRLSALQPENLLATPHIGYVTRGLYEVFYRDSVESISAWLDRR